VEATFVAWVHHVVASAPEIFVFLAIAIGTLLGRIRIHGFTIGAAACSVGIVVTLAPMIVGTLFAHRVLRMNPVIVCGALAGAMTVDAAVAGSCEVAESQTSVLGVAICHRQRPFDGARADHRRAHFCVG